MFLGAFGAFSAFDAFKKNKKLKTAVITSFILLILSYYKHEFVESQPFSIITIFLNDYNTFKSSQYFQIITIIFEYYNHHIIF